MTFLELKIPPVVVAVVTAGLSWVLSEAGPVLLLSPAVRLTVAIFLCGVGLTVAAAGVREFLRVRTTINPHQPRHASVLVTTGIYRFTRNPMYLGLLLFLTAWAVYFGSLLGFLPLAFFILYMDRFQIEPEERALSVAFGQKYLIYRREVRRWI